LPLLNLDDKLKCVEHKVAFLNFHLVKE